MIPSQCKYLRLRPCCRVDPQLARSAGISRCSQREQGCVFVLPIMCRNCLGDHGRGHGSNLPSTRISQSTGLRSVVISIGRRHCRRRVSATVTSIWMEIPSIMITAPVSPPDHKRTKQRICQCGICRRPCWNRQAMGTSCLQRACTVSVGRIAFSGGDLTWASWPDGAPVVSVGGYFS